MSAAPISIDTGVPREEEEGRSKLKIFLGAAPGVGKTHAMLFSGRAQVAADGLFPGQGEAAPQWL